MPSAYFEATPAFNLLVATGRSIDVQQRQLEGLDMEIRKTIVIPKDKTCEAAALTRKGPFFAQAKSGKPVFRVRSGPAYRVLSEVYQALPEVGGFESRKIVGAKANQTFFVDAGAEFTIGRLCADYPRKGMVIQHPITAREATLAVVACGQDLTHLPLHAMRPYPLIAAPGLRTVSVNPNSDNGFPVLAKYSSPGAPEMVMGLALTIRKELQKAIAGDSVGGVKEWKEAAEEERPWLVSLRGKCKADCYSTKKIQEGKLRYYNAMPRQIMLNIQVASQVYEGLSQTILTEGNSGIGLSLVRGGAQDLVTVLDARLALRGRAYVHVGDDSWVTLKVGRNVVRFALDCTSFDLTQHGDATKEVHRAVWRQLRRIDAIAADLWYEYARGRQVVLMGTLVRYLRHAGPSGMPLQSKINDALMEVLIVRALETGCDWTNAEAVDSVLQDVGRGLGFKVRVEQHSCLIAETVKEALEQESFLFIGYYFHVRDGEVRVCADLPRSLAQLPYPNLKWMKTDKEMIVSEAMRVGSILMSLGMPTRASEAAVERWRAEAIRQLKVAIETYGDVTSNSLRWALGEVAVGPALELNLTGLIKALERDPRLLWMTKEEELPSTSELVSLAWADMVESEEESAALTHRFFVPPASMVVKAVSAPKGVQATHPVTDGNDGRPPPTVKWGPPKPPRREKMTAVKKPKGRHRGKVYPEDEEEAWFSEEEDYDEYY